MKADRILVVMNGEIVEEGSHDDLVHKHGKYHDLWSKQILVKSAPDQSRSQSPKKQDAQIINDLTPNRHKVELAKALKVTPHDQTCENTQQKPDDTQTSDEGVGGTSSDLCQELEGGKKPVEGTNSGRGHQHEVSALSD
jgi:ABC-type dipeptide/oligopeptide/nickel transport system ATPase component